MHNMDQFTPNQHRALALAPKPPAVLSFFSSAYVILRIVRQRRRQDTAACRDRGDTAGDDGTGETKKRHRKKSTGNGRVRSRSGSGSGITTYDRLVLGMSCNTLLQSAVYFWGTWAMPSAPGESAGSYIHGARGNFNTCTAQGILVQLTYCAIPFYYAALCLYALGFLRTDGGITRHRRHRRTMLRMEPYVHGLAYVGAPLVTSIVVGRADMFNPAGSVCWIEGYPMGCGSNGGVDCVRGDDESINLYKGLAGLLPLLLFFALALAFVLAMYCSEWRRDEMLRRAAAEGGGTNTLAGKMCRSEVKTREKRRNAVARHALAYLTSFGGTSACGIAAQIFQLSTGRASFAAILVGAISWSLQGFVNAALYSVLPSVDVSPAGSLCTATEVQSAAGRSSSDGGRRRTSSLSQASDDEMLEKGLSAAAAKRVASSRKESSGSRNMMYPVGHKSRKSSFVSRGSFSIYDGSQASRSDAWKEFVFDDDEPDECDPYDYTDETGRMQASQTRQMPMPMPSVIRVFGAQGGHGGGRVAPALGRHDLTSSSSGDSSMERFNAKNAQRKTGEEE